MPVIELKTFIKSDIEIWFDLSRSIDLHQLSTTQTNEKAIAGKTSGLINLDEFVTWQATHFGIRQKLTSKITAYNRPFYFRDEQQKGTFKFFIHDHYFQSKNEMVEMTDVFTFESPFGFAGRLFNMIVLTKHLKNLLIKRNAVIKEFAETCKWQIVLNNIYQ
ncbi:MAG TPA: SRPBCC family protein [Parafilimonas sp.]|nr:SRPBCC family protein [Parafilimonas sp.]